jgi:glycosyltransferase involved in cell wall biosynthesis
MDRNARQRMAVQYASGQIAEDASETNGRTSSVFIEENRVNVENHPKPIPPSGIATPARETQRIGDRVEAALSRSEALIQSDHAQTLELSVVIPCLNEADTVAECVAKAVTAVQELGIAGEVIVADNGSTDGSRELAAEAGARVVSVPEKGYGAALMGGIAAARGRFVIMGDADDSYDFTQIEPFYRKLRQGMDIVQGCRLPRGGGTVMPGAMPPLHRWVGNPALSFLVRTMFRTPVNDVYCGMRGFRKDWQQSLDQRCTGMEFATEMIVKSTLFGGAMDQVPITLYPDGRVASRSHLRTFRDGWRTLRFFLLLSPRWTFLIPGACLAAIGVLLYALALPQFVIGGAALDVHTLLAGTLSILVASQMVWCAILAKTFAVTEGLLPRNAKLDWFARVMTLERLLVASLAMGATGLTLIGLTALQWAASGFGPLDYATTMRWMIPGSGLVALACQFGASSFLLSVLRMARL